MLLSGWFLLALIGVTVATTGGLVHLELRRRRRRRDRTLGALRAWSARTGSVVLVLALVIVTVADRENREYQYIPSFEALVASPSPDLAGGGLGEVARLVEHPGMAPAVHGTDVEVTISGPRSKISRVAYVYLPPAYFRPAHRDQRFPVLYLLHGSPGVAVDWIRGGQVDRTMDHLLLHRSIEPFIIVMPDVNGGFERDLECQDVVHGPEDQTYLAEDVPSWVDAHLRTIPDRLHRAIGGLSTGAYCGLNVMFRHQATFSAAISHSGTGKPDHGRYTGNLFDGHRQIQLANTPDAYLSDIGLERPLGVYLDAGQSDTWSQGQYRKLLPPLLQRGIPTTYHVVAGEKHSYDTWRRNVSFSLPWVSNWFATQQAPTVVDHLARPDANYLPPLTGRYARRHHDRRDPTTGPTPMTRATVAVTPAPPRPEAPVDETPPTRHRGTNRARATSHR